MLCAPCLHAIGSSDTLTATRIAAASFGLFSGFFMGNIFPAAFEIVPVSARASAVGVLNLFGGAISGFAPLFGGLWKKTFGLDRLLTVTGFVYFVAALLIMAGLKLWVRRDYERIH